MKVLLATPVIRQSYQRIPDIGLGYLATGLRKRGHEVDIFQCEKDKLSVDRFASKVAEKKPDALGLKVFSLDLPTVRRSIRAVKDILPEILIILGGPHPSCADPSELMEYFPEVDFAFRGEADIGLPMLIDFISDNRQDLKEIAGLIFREDGRLCCNEPARVQDLDSLGFPSWDLIDPNGYTDRWSFWLKNVPTGVILYTRGCPYNCTFCAAQVVSGKKVRKRSIANVLKEMELLYNDYSIRSFDFIDDNFITMKRDILLLCDEIKKREWELEWSIGGVRLDALDKETIQAIDGAGCCSISVGIESGSERILKDMKKALTLEVVEEKLALIRENSNISIMGQFIMGYPTETVGDIKKTISFACSSLIDYVTFYPFHPLPGSEVYEDLIRKGELSGVDWSSITPDTKPYSPPGISLNRLKWLYRYAYLRFYLRPKTWVKIYENLTDLDHVKKWLKRAKNKLWRND